MKNRPAKFYSDFEYFISEVSKEMDKHDRITSSWLKAIGHVLGNHFLAKLLVQELKTAMPIIIPTVGTLSTGYSLQSAIKSSLEEYNKNKSDFDESEEKQRLKKAQIIYGEVQLSENKKENINELFNDLVTGEEILY